MKSAQRLRDELRNWLYWTTVDGVEPEDLAGVGSSWFYRPYTPEELDSHPDQERILATAQAAIEAFALKMQCALSDDDE